MKYYVDISVEGFFSWEGNAESREAAKQMAIDAACEANFGELKDVDFDVYQIEEDK